MSNHVLILSGPSGVGKTTIANKIMEIDPQWKKVITCTTRGPRTEEIADSDYKFMSNGEFESHLSIGDFLESAVVYGRNYGTLKQDFYPVYETNSVIFVVSFKGMQSLKEIFPKAVTVFLRPPDNKELYYRIQNRGVECDNELRWNFDIEMQNCAQYDYVLINHDVEETANNILSLIAAGQQSNV